MKRLVIVLGFALLVVAQRVSAADLPAALIDPYLQVQVALSSDQFNGIAGHAQAIAHGRDSPWKRRRGDRDVVRRSSARRRTSPRPAPRSAR